MSCLESIVTIALYGSHTFNSNHYYPILAWPALHLRNRDIFLFHFDHTRYEALLQESFQVQETVSGFITWAWVSNFDIDRFDTHNKHH